MGLVNRVVPPAEIESYVRTLCLHHRRQRAADDQGGEDGDRCGGRGPRAPTPGVGRGGDQGVPGERRLRRGPPRLHGEAQAGLQEGPMRTESTMDDRITLYGSFTSSSTYKPMLFLALARLPFSFRTVNLKTGKQNEPEYLAVNRYGKVPALRHRGLTIVQSNVILDYLARVTGHFEGASEQERWQAREWLSWEADAIQNIARVRHFSRFRAVDPAVMAYFRPLAEEALAFMDKSLAGRDWLVGETCTIADIGCWGRMVFMAEGGMDIARWPNVEAWSRRLAAMPGFALPYDLIPKKDQEMLPA